MLPSKSVPQIMLSTEIVKIINDLREDGAAVLRHSTFMEKIVKVLGEKHSAEFSAQYKDSTGRVLPCYALPKREANLMVMSESYKVQAAVYDRMVELESKPLTTAEMLYQSSLLLLEQERKLTEVETKVETIEHKIDLLQVDLRNGVPQGFISKENARIVYAKGLSKKIFHEVMSALNVPQQTYISYGDGFSTPTFAYQEDHIATAVTYFVKDLEQVTRCKCFSMVLNKRVDYTKVPNYGLKVLAA